ncbi:MAG: TA system VapC family ribonuclease toxin [Nocardioides sp.]
MLFLDVDVCLHGLFPDSSPEAEAVTRWLEQALGGIEPVAINEQVLSSMIRIATNPHAFTVPSSTDDALAFAEELLAAPASVRVTPGPRHWALFTGLVRRYGLRGNHMPDAYLASLAMEQGATMVSRDRGFARFRELRHLDPLAS